MKKKHRTITVKGIVYGWTINHDNDEGGNALNIWYDKKIIYRKEMNYNFDGNDSIEITPRVVRKAILEMLGEPPEADPQIKESVKFLIKNKKHYDEVALYARQAYDAWSRKNPIKRQDGAFREYESYEILNETDIQINYIYGAYEMEFDGQLCVNIDTNEITKTK